MTTTDLKKAFARGLYIHAPDETLTHFSGCLIEGLLDLGIPVKTNATSLTMRPVSMPLHGVDLSAFHSAPLTGFSAYLVDISTHNAFVPFEGVDPAPVGYITTSDISAFCDIPNPHILFAAHDSRHVVKPGVRQPIAFGLADRLIEKTETRSTYADREQKALHSFRPTLQQGVRALLDLAFVPALKNHMPVERIDSPPGQYLQTLMNSALCLCYGGDFYSPIVGNSWFEKNQPDVYAHHSFEHIEPAAVLRWDSWRFWEALSAGCVAIHLDFEKYGFNLPVMPEPWVHYAPIDLANLEGSAAEIWERQTDWAAIADQGRAWAIEHYAPAPTAERVLRALAESLP